MLKTTEKVVTQEIGLWAVPKAHIEPGEEPMSYELYGTTYHYKTGAIHICMVQVEAHVPEGVDLLGKALETLDKRAEQAMKDYQTTMKSIADQRRDLLRLSAPAAVVDPIPDGGVLVDEKPASRFDENQTEDDQPF